MRVGYVLSLCAFAFGCSTGEVPPTDSGPGALDDVCSEDDECGPGLSCSLSRRQCRRILDETCENDDQCATEFCGNFRCAPNECNPDAGLACSDSTLVCTGGPCGRTCEFPAIRGERCLERSDANQCPFTTTCIAGLVCAQRNFPESANGDCAPATGRDPGEPCDVDLDCSAGLVCNVGIHNCVNDK
jgi:hypothetical protein